MIFQLERLQEFNNKIAASAELTQEVVETLRSLPKTTHPMAALACGIQSLGVPTPPLHPTIEVVTLKKFDDAACPNHIRDPIDCCCSSFLYGNELFYKIQLEIIARTFCHLCFLVMGMMKSQKQSVRH